MPGLYKIVSIRCSTSLGAILGRNTFFARMYKVCLALSVLTSLLLAGCEPPAPPSAADYLGAAYLANPAELEQEVDQNGVAFQEKYSGKYIIVIGYVDGIDPDHFSVARKYQYFNKEVGISVPETAKVGCAVRSDKQSGLSDLREGQGIIVAGRVDFKAGGIFDPINLDDCVWVPADGSYTLESARTAIQTTLQ